MFDDTGNDRVGEEARLRSCLPSKRQSVQLMCFPSFVLFLVARLIGARLVVEFTTGSA